MYTLSAVFAGTLIARNGFSLLLILLVYCYKFVMLKYLAV